MLGKTNETRVYPLPLLHSTGRYLKFTDKYKAEAISIVPMLTEDGRPLLRIIEKEPE